MHPDDITEIYRPVFMSIEMNVVDMYRQNPSLVDHNVGKVYEGLQRTFEKELKGKNPPRLRWKGPEEDLYDRLMAICMAMMGEGELRDEEDNVIELDAVISKPELVKVLKRLRSSIKTWTGKTRGRTGYLDYISKFM